MQTQKTVQGDVKMVQDIWVIAFVVFAKEKQIFCPLFVDISPVWMPYNMSNLYPMALPVTKPLKTSLKLIKLLSKNAGKE
jgi:hypothetical protein